MGLSPRPYKGRGWGKGLPGVRLVRLLVLQRNPSASLCLAEEELTTGIFPTDGAETDKTRQKGDDTVAGKAGKTDKLVKRVAPLQEGKEVADAVVVSKDGALWPLGLAPEDEVDGRGQDVLVANADIGASAALTVECKDGLAEGWGDGGDDDGAPLGMIGVEVDAGLGPAVLIGGLVHHEDFFLGTDSGEIPVVTDSYEQSPAIGIGEGRDGLGQLAGIGDAVLEVLLLMLAFTD